MWVEAEEKEKKERKRRQSKKIFLLAAFLSFLAIQFRFENHTFETIQLLCF